MRNVKGRYLHVNFKLIYCLGVKHSQEIIL